MADMEDRTNPKLSVGKGDEGLLGLSIAKQKDKQGAAPAEYVTPLLRKAFAQHLRNTPYLTPGLAQTLAHDVETMSLGQNGADQRPAQTEGAEDSLAALAATTYNLSLQLREQLIARHSLPAELADRITLHGREGTLTRAIQTGQSASELGAFVAYLAENGGLTPSFLLRALCLGHMTLFEIAMARLAGLSTEEATRRIHDPDASSFSDLYKSAGLPGDLYRAFRIAVKVHRNRKSAQSEPWHHGCTIEVIESLVKEYEHLSPEDLEHVLSQLAREQRASASLVRDLKLASA